MSSCSTLLKGLAAKCEGNLGGVKQIAIVDWHSVNWSSIAYDADGVVTGLTMNDGAQFVTFAAAKNTAGINSNLTKNDENGVSYWTNVLSFNINHLDETKRLEVNALALGHLAALVTDKNGITHLLGADDYATTTDGSMQTGAAADDGNFYGLTITDRSVELPAVVDPTLVASLVKVLPAE